MNVSKEELQQINKEELEAVLLEKCQKGYKTHEKRKTKKMFGKTYRNCVKAEEGMEQEVEEAKKAGINPELHCASWDYEAAFVGWYRHWRKLVEEGTRDAEKPAVAAE